MGHGVLVTGATGTVGRHLVGRLLAHGVRVRALCRDPARAAALLPEGAEIAGGDLTDGATLEPALRGVDAAFVLLAEDAGAAFALAAQRAPGLRRLVALSADAPRGAGLRQPAVRQARTGRSPPAGHGRAAHRAAAGAVRLAGPAVGARPRRG